MNKKENYIYNISLATQIGKKDGRLFLTVIQNKIDGFLEILGSKQGLTGEITDEGCVLKGQLKTLVSIFDYTAVGHFDKEIVSLSVSYMCGIFRLTGNCIGYTIEMS